MRILVIDADTQERIAALLKYAKEHPFTIEMLREIGEGKRPIPGEDPMFTIHIAHGFKVVYTEELQAPGRVAHLSVSVDTPKKAPSPAAVDAILKAFEMLTMDEGSDVGQINIENTSEDGGIAISIQQVISNELIDATK